MGKYDELRNASMTVPQSEAPSFQILKTPDPPNDDWAKPETDTRNRNYVIPGNDPMPGTFRGRPGLPQPKVPGFETDRHMEVDRPVGLAAPELCWPQLKLY